MLTNAIHMVVLTSADSRAPILPQDASPMPIAAAATPRLSVAKDKLKFVLLEGIHANAVESLQAAGYTQVVTHAKALEGAALVEAVRDAHFLGIRSRTQLTAQVIAAAP